MFRQDYTRDFDALLAQEEPFAFVRFHDGEHAILEGLPYRAASKWRTNGKDVWLRDELRAALDTTLDRFYVGISPPCCTPRAAEYFRRFVRGDKVTFATLFQHRNYTRVEELRAKFPNALLIGSSSMAELRVPADGISAKWDLQGLVDEMLTIDRPFFVAAGPCANVIIHRYWSLQDDDKRQTAIDVGAALDLLLHKTTTRHYHHPSSKLLLHECEWEKWTPFGRRKEGSSVRLPPTDETYAKLGEQGFIGSNRVVKQDGKKKNLKSSAVPAKREIAEEAGETRSARSGSTTSSSDGDRPGSPPSLSTDSTTAPRTQVMFGGARRRTTSTKNRVMGRRNKRFQAHAAPGAEAYRKQRQQRDPPSIQAKRQFRKLGPSQHKAKPAARAVLIHPLLPDPDPAPLLLSVVFGTYNRLDRLRACVESVRRACSEIAYEIVVSDGGSTDGSRQWLEKQDDVVLLNGDLSGAVNAFNAAARKAQGEFILAINDDAELDPSAVTNALKYFDNPMVGQAALSYREGGHWKIQPLFGRVYANFAMTRTNIIRTVEKICGGMWADCYRTYGGDPELSCWVYRLGYEVAAAQDAKLIHHFEVDELRRSNVDQDVERHQFSKRWSEPCLKFRGPLPNVRLSEIENLRSVEAGESVQQRWSRIESVDPVVGVVPPRAPLKPEKLLHWQLWTHEDPQTDMVQGLKKLGSAGHECIKWTNMPVTERGRQFVEAMRSLRPTVAFLQCQDAHAVPVDAVRAAREDPDRDPSLVLCLWNGDIGPNKGPWENTQDQWQHAMAKHADLMLFTGTGQVAVQRQRGMQNAAYLQIGYDTDRYFLGRPEDYGTKHQIVFVGNRYGSQFSGMQLRVQIVDALRRFKGFTPYGAGFGATLPQAASGDVYRKSLIAVSASLEDSLGRYTSDRLFRALACGCAVFVKRFEDMEGLGLKDKENCIVWETVSQLVELIQMWSPRREELLEIGRNGAALASTLHTWDVRMEELQALLNAVRKQR
jgi:hypothetical protein